MPSRRLPDIPALLAKVRGNIAKHGWHFTYVFSDDASPSVVYTTGLFATHNHPELVMFGVGESEAGGILHSAATLVADGVSFRDFDRSDKVVEGLPVVFRGVSEAAALARCKITREIAAADGTTMPPVLQIVWPDPKGMFPWDEGYDRKFVPIQPVLAMGALADPKHIQ